MVQKQHHRLPAEASKFLLVSLNKKIQVDRIKPMQCIAQKVVSLTIQEQEGIPYLHQQHLEPNTHLYSMLQPYQAVKNLVCST